MNAPAPDDIAKAVLRWQHQHPLAQRLDTESVQGIGLVCLPFVRASETPGSEPMQAPWRRSLHRLLRRPSLIQGRPAFLEDFIDGISPTRAAAFALRHGVETIEGAEGWPQRRIAIDSQRAEAVQGGWPFELWVATAALDGAQGRQRVLVGLSTAERMPAVMGQRHWDLRRLAMAAAAVLLAVGAVVVVVRKDPPPPPALKVVGAVEVASASASAPASASVAASAPMPRASSFSAAPPGTPPPSAAPSVPLTATPVAAQASVSASASLPLPSQEPASTAAVALPPPSDPPIDIRPRLGVIRERSAPKPPIGGALPRPQERKAAAPPSTTTPSSASVKQPPSAQAPAAPLRPHGTATTPVPDAPNGPAPSASGPERVNPRWPASGQPTLALVSGPFKSRADAEAMLTRMREHVGKAVPSPSSLAGEVFDSPDGFRAAIYPFGSREEAQLINVTMVARGWRTRAVPF